MTCITPRARAASVPGRIGIHQSDFAAVGLRVRVDGDDLRAALAGLVLDRPEVDVGDGGVRAPVDDVAAVHRRLGVDHRPGAERDVAAGRAGGGADGAVEQRRPEPVEEPPVEAGVLQLAHRAGVAVRQDRLRPVGRRRDRLEPRRRSSRTASSQEMRSNLPFALRPTRRSGYSSRSGW